MGEIEVLLPAECLLAIRNRVTKVSNNSELQCVPSHYEKIYVSKAFLK